MLLGQGIQDLVQGHPLVGSVSVGGRPRLPHPVRSEPRPVWLVGVIGQATIVALGLVGAGQTVPPGCYEVTLCGWLLCGEEQVHDTVVAGLVAADGVEQGPSDGAAHSHTGQRFDVGHGVSMADGGAVVAHGDLGAVRTLPAEPVRPVVGGLSHDASITGRYPSTK